MWRLLCAHWDVYRGTPVRYWLESELADIFGVDRAPVGRRPPTRSTTRSPSGWPTDAYRPRALYERFGIAVLATTDDPCDDLSAHAALAADPTWSGRVIPTFRPDRYLEPGRARLAATRWPSSARPPTSTPATTRATCGRWRRAGGTSSSTAPSRPTTATTTSRTDPLEPPRPARIYRSALAADATAAEAVAFRRHMLLEMARMSCDDGLVMTLHPGVRRGHHGPTARAFGPDTGHDIPIAVEFTDALRPAAGALRHAPRASTSSSFTLDETVFSRELAPLAGFYPSVYVGVALVVPRRAGRDPAVPGRGHRDRRVLPHLRLRRRHPRVLLDPGPPRHVPPGRRGLARPARGRAPARRGRGRSRPRVDLVAAQPDAGVQAVTPAPVVRSHVPPAGSGGGPGPPGPPRARQLLPRPPGLVHRPRARRRRVGHRRVHRPQRRAGRRASPLRTASTRSSPRRRDGDRFEVLGSLSRAHAAADHDAWLGYLASPGRPRGHDHRHRGRLSARRRRRPRPRPRRGAGRRRGAARATRPPSCAPPPRRLAAGIAARRHADAGPLTARALRQPARQRRRGRPGASTTSPSWSTPASRAWLDESVSLRHHRWSTGSRPAPRPTDRRAVAGRHGRRRLLPGRHRAVPASGCSAARSPAGARAGTRPAPPSPTTSSPSRSASSGCSTAPTRCWPTPVRPAATRPSRTRSPTTPAGSGCSSGGTEASRHLDAARPT